MKECNCKTWIDEFGNPNFNWKELQNSNFCPFCGKKLEEIKT